MTSEFKTELSKLMDMTNLVITSAEYELDELRLDIGDFALKSYSDYSDTDEVAKALRARVEAKKSRYTEICDKLDTVRDISEYLLAIDQLLND